MFKRRYHTNKGKKYLTAHRKSRILTARFVTGIFALILLPAIWSFVYTQNYNLVDAARAEVPVKPPVLTTYQQISDATNGENVDVIYNLCKAESGCRKFAVNVNRNGTKDFSWLQINSIHIIGEKEAHGKGTITMDCVYDLSCVARWTNKQIKNGNLHIWVTSKQI